jgi:carbon-monoxide dehydrogenase small subunit
VRVDITLNVNDTEHRLSVAPHQTLVEVLREELGFHDVKVSCCEGECGACTVLVDGRPVNACMTLAVLANGSRITTIRGLAGPGELHPLQKSLIEHGAVQCGYCSPGMILSAKALLDRNPHPGEAELKRALSGNVCRCTGYQQIVEAILAVANGEAPETPR